MIGTSAAHCQMANGIIIILIGHRYASLFYCRQYRHVSVVFVCLECLWVINVEGHAAQCRMARTTIAIRVTKRQDRRTQHKNANTKANILMTGHRYASLFYRRKYRNIFPCFLLSGMRMSDQRWSSCCTFSDGQRNTYNTRNKRARSKNSARKCEDTPGHEMSGRTTKWLPIDGESLG